MDQITISGLKIFCNHGVYESEIENGQNFYVDAVLGLDTYAPGVADDLEKSVNYAELCHDIDWFMKDNRYNLIEAVAENLSAHILNDYPLIRELTITIHKPEAPIGMPFKDVCVTIHRKWERAYIAYGSNLGDSIRLINSATEKISSNPAIRVLNNSSLYQTEPYGVTDQPDFYNGCLEIETYLPAHKLLDVLQSLENEAGRVRTMHWGPRTLDLDLLIYGNELINDERLTVPHIDMANRNFVLEPLCEIAPYAFDIRTGKTARQMFDELNKTT